MSSERFQLYQGEFSRSYRDVLLGSSTEWEFSTSGARISPNTGYGEDVQQISNSLALSKLPGAKQVTTNIPQAMFDCFMDMACKTVDNTGQIIETLAILVGYQDAEGNGHGTHLVFPVQEATCSHVNDRGINGQDTVWYMQEYLKPEIEEHYHNSQFKILTWIHTHVRGTNICFSSVDLHTQGLFTYDICKCLAYWTPLSPLSTFHAAYQYCSSVKFGDFSNPSPSVRTSCVNVPSACI